MKIFIRLLGLAAIGFLVFKVFHAESQPAASPPIPSPGETVPDRGGLATGAEIDAIVLKFQAAYADTFDRRDARGMAALVTDDATFQNEWGEVAEGRSVIEKNLTALMAKLSPGVTLKDTSLTSREVVPGVIVCHGISHRRAPDGTSTEMFFTRVLVRQGSEWKLAATEIARPSSVLKHAPQAK